MWVSRPNPLPSSVHTHRDTGSLPPLPHTKGAVSFTLTVQMEVYPSMYPTSPPTVLCTLKVLISFHYPHALCLSYYIPAKPASLTMYQQKSSHFSMQLFFVKSVSCKSISVIISCSHQNLQSYGTMMRNLCYAGRTTKATFFLLLTTSCLPKHN